MDWDGWGWDHRGGGGKGGGTNCCDMHGRVVVVLGESSLRSQVDGPVSLAPQD